MHQYRSNVARILSSFSTAQRLAGSRLAISLLGVVLSTWRLVRHEPEVSQIGRPVTLLMSSVAADVAESNSSLRPVDSPLGTIPLERCDQTPFVRYRSLATAERSAPRINQKRVIGVDPFILLTAFVSVVRMRGLEPPLPCEN